MFRFSLTWSYAAPSRSIRSAVKSPSLLLAVTTSRRGRTGGRRAWTLSPRSPTSSTRMPHVPEREQESDTFSLPKQMLHRIQSLTQCNYRTWNTVHNRLIVILLCMIHSETVLAAISMQPGLALQAHNAGVLMADMTAALVTWCTDVSLSVILHCGWLTSLWTTTKLSARVVRTLYQC